MSITLHTQSLIRRRFGRRIALVSLAATMVAGVATGPGPGSADPCRPGCLQHPGHRQRLHDF